MGKKVRTVLEAREVVNTMIYALFFDAGLGNHLRIRMCVDILYAGYFYGRCF